MIKVQDLSPESAAVRVKQIARQIAELSAFLKTIPDTPDRESARKSYQVRIDALVEQADALQKSVREARP